MFRYIKKHAFACAILAGIIIAATHVCLSIILTSRDSENAASIINASTALTLVTVLLLMFPITNELNRPRGRKRR